MGGVSLLVWFAKPNKRNMTQITSNDKRNPQRKVPKGGVGVWVVVGFCCVGCYLFHVSFFLYVVVLVGFVSLGGFWVCVVCKNITKTRRKEISDTIN